MIKVTPSSNSGTTAPTAGDVPSSAIHDYCKTQLQSIGDDTYVREGLTKLRRSAADAATLRTRVIDFVAQDGASANRLAEQLPHTLEDLRGLIKALSADFR